jgi:anti-sigma factor RsiW
MTHPDNEVLFQVLDGELPDEARTEAVRLHLADCPRCSAMVDSARALGDGLRVWADETSQGDFDLADAVMAGIQASETEAPTVKPRVGTPKAEPSHATGGKVLFLRRMILPALVAVAASVFFYIGHRTTPVKPQVAPVALAPEADPTPVGASVARVEVVGAQSYAVLEVPGLQDGATTSVVWIQDDPEDPTPEESPMAVQ